VPIKIIAGHGASIKENGVWKNQIIDDCLWKEQVITLLNGYVLLCPDSFIEEKQFSLAWHYRGAESESGNALSRELIHCLDNIIKSYNLIILDGNKVVEIMSKKIGKGKAAQKLLEQNDFDFILSIGDDATDEDMFEFFLQNPLAFTIKVGKGNTCAKYRIDTVDDVIELLKRLSE
jgi:trehalose 6-phosphate synthase/phosphatase